MSHVLPLPNHLLFEGAAALFMLVLLELLGGLLQFIQNLQFTVQIGGGLDVRKKLRAVPMELSEDVWKSVFKNLPNRDLKSVSLVSKQFYSISNNLVSNLKIADSEDQYLILPQLLNKFTSLKSIRFHHRDFTTTGDRSLIKIAHSGLKHLQKIDLGCQLSLPVEGIKELGFANMRTLKVLCVQKLLNNSDLLVIASSLPWLQELDIYGLHDTNGIKELGFANMTTLRILRCSRVYDSDLLVIASSLPWLQELDIHSCDLFTDKGVAQLAGNLPSLLRINMSRNNFISDQSLCSLLSSCPRIAEIDCHMCKNITVKGVMDAICGYPNLLSLKSGFIDFVRRDSSCCYLDFSRDVRESGHILASLERANLPLREVIFNFSDLHISSFLKFFRQLRVIKINYCSQLTNATFFLLVANCLSLAEIEISGTPLGKETNYLLAVKKNDAIKTLTLNFNIYLSDETLKRIVLSCPNLECLEMYYCLQVTDKGIGYILSNCPGIKKLKVYSRKLQNVPWVGKDGQVSELKLEVLGILGVGMDDKRMSMIAERFPHLVQLEIMSGGNVSAKGVEELMEQCKGLREVRLGDRIAGMVFLRSGVHRFGESKN